MIFFISDTHFCHRGSLLWQNQTFPRPFTSIEEADETMISNWNSVVSEDDEVYFLGDFAYKCNKNKAETIFWRLNGKKHLISGNHDYKIASKFTNCWDSINNMATITFTKDDGNVQEIVLCHYPLLSWRHQHQGAWHLHGHTHGSIQELNKGTKRFDVGVENINYTPISLEQINNLLS